MLEAALLVTLSALPRTAHACSVCFSAAEEARIAYYVTTGLLMLLPFVLIGVLLLWLRRAARSRRDSPALHP